MTAAAAVAAVRPGHGIELGLHEMLAAGTAVSASAKDPDLVDKVRFLHCGLFFEFLNRKYTALMRQPGKPVFINLLRGKACLAPGWPKSLSRACKIGWADELPDEYHPLLLPRLPSSLLAAPGIARSLRSSTGASHR